MSNTFSIKVENLSKVYSLSKPKVDSNGNTVREHWALKNVSFEVKKGESVGILGANGSGKSTLLKILAGVTKPSSGKVTIHGKVASVLDIGAGFHPELSGYDNIFLNGQIQGFSKKEIQSKINQIIEFSGVAKFIQEPVKNYSSGMYLRLAFSILSHFDFDVYLFDEVLSVGDAEFTLKTQNKFRELSAQGKTIIFVSHNLSELSNQDKYILLKRGEIKEKTEKRNLLSYYLEDVLQTENIKIHTSAYGCSDFSSFPLSSEIKVSSIKFYQKETKTFNTGVPFIFEVEFEKLFRTGTIDPVLIVSGITENILLSSSPFISGKSSNCELIHKMKYQCEIPSHFFGSQVYRLSLCFIKNLNNVEAKHENSKLVSNNFDEKMGCEVVLHWQNIVTFKPTFKNTKLDIDISTINLQGSLLPAFKWNNVSKIN